jgi:hypothetical protein
MTNTTPCLNNGCWNASLLDNGLCFACAKNRELQDRVATLSALVLEYGKLIERLTSITEKLQTKLDAVSSCTGYGGSPGR